MKLAVHNSPNGENWRRTRSVYFKKSCRFLCSTMYFSILSTRVSQPLQSIFVSRAIASHGRSERAVAVQKDTMSALFESGPPPKNSQKPHDLTETGQHINNRPRIEPNSPVAEHFGVLAFLDFVLPVSSSGSASSNDHLLITTTSSFAYFH